MRDLHNNISPAYTIEPKTITTGTITGDPVDVKGFQAAELVVVTGTITDGTMTCELQESDVSGSGFAAVADADLIGTEPVFILSDDKVVKRCGYIGSKRYLKCVITASGATTGGPMAALILRGHAAIAPVA